VTESVKAGSIAPLEGDEGRFIVRFARFVSKPGRGGQLSEALISVWDRNSPAYRVYLARNDAGNGRSVIAVKSIWDDAARMREAVGELDRPYRFEEYEQHVESWSIEFFEVFHLVKPALTTQGQRSDPAEAGE
jgi:hypothetical protein